MQRSVIAKHLHFTHISCYHCQDKKQLEKIHKEQND
jgi:NAD-dependent SIR2 family protein deacetylase